MSTRWTAHREERKRRGFETPWLVGILVAVVFTGVFGLAIPLWAIANAARVSAEAAAAAAVIQASTSFLATILAVAAGIVAVLAYLNSVQKPNLTMSMVALGNDVVPALMNDGTSTAHGVGANGVVEAKQFTAEVLAGHGWLPFPGEANRLQYFTEDPIMPGVLRHLPRLAVENLRTQAHLVGEVEFAITFTWVSTDTGVKSQRFDFVLPAPADEQNPTSAN